MNIVSSCDENYAPHVGVMLHSLLMNTSKPNTVNFYLIDNGITEHSKGIISLIAKQFSARTIFINARSDLFEGLETKRYGVATYQRLALVDLLPSNVDHVIYLDSDIIITSDITEMWQELLSIESIGAVENFSPRPAKRLNIDRSSYFNAGVLAINLNYWRKYNSKQIMIDFLRSDALIIHLDQCALNFAFRENWTRLDLKWNVQADVFGVIEKYYDKDCGYSIDELVNAAKNPGIVHFIGTQKPWFWNCYSPYKKLFLEAKANSAWRDAPPADDSFKARLKNKMALKKHLRRIKLEKWLANEEANSL